MGTALAARWRPGSATGEMSRDTGSPVCSVSRRISSADASRSAPSTVCCSGLERISKSRSSDSFTDWITCFSSRTITPSTMLERMVSRLNPRSVESSRSRCCSCDKRSRSAASRVKRREPRKMNVAGFFPSAMSRTTDSSRRQRSRNARRSSHPAAAARTTRKRKNPADIWRARF